MRLPNAEQAVVAREKITEYLLSFTSREGAGKARFFYSFGFRTEEWEEFAEALRSLCLRNAVAEIEETEYGIKHVIIGNITTPDGRNPMIITVWQLDHGADFPRFISAYPPD